MSTGRTQRMIENVVETARQLERGAVYVVADFPDSVARRIAGAIDGATCRPAGRVVSPAGIANVVVVRPLQREALRGHRAPVFVDHAVGHRAIADALGLPCIAVRTGLE